MMVPHPFWFLLLMACLVWYGVITGYVTWHGGRDILVMLDRLGRAAKESDPDARPPADS